MTAVGGGYPEPPGLIEKGNQRHLAVAGRLRHRCEDRIGLVRQSKHQVPTEQLALRQLVQQGQTVENMPQIHNQSSQRNRLPTDIPAAIIGIIMYCAAPANTEHRPALSYIQTMPF